MTATKLFGCVLLLLATTAPLFAQPLQTQDGLRLTLDREGGVASVTTGGKDWPQARGGSGLLLRDAAADGEFVAAGGTLTERDGAVAQSGVHQTLQLKFEAVHMALPGAIQVSGFIQDLSRRDRAITVRFALPIEPAGVLWWPDALRRPEKATGLHSNLRATGVGATGSSSAYPWGAISGPCGEICLAVPMDRFVVHRIEYDAQAKSFHVDFDFGLSSLTKAFPSRADFSLVVYTADADWGFRSAAAKYYALFPEAFKRRAEKEGLWMPFTDVAKVEDPEDFNFIFQEGAPNVSYDDAHGIYSFVYISPHWAWLWMPDRKDRPTPEYVKQKLAEDLKSEKADVRKRAQLIVNCSGMNADGDYHYNIGRAHWAPSNFGPVGWYAMFPANADPDLEKLGKGPTTGAETMETVESQMAKHDRPGSFLDGFYLDGVDERPLDNYAREQFPFAEAPLTFGKDTKRPILCGAFTSYKFLKRLSERVHATGRMLIANGIPSQFPFSAGYLDAAGSEIEPPIENEPVTLAFLTSARALLYHKPLLLLYKPRIEERFDRDLSPYLLDYMNTCLLYAAEPSLFKIFSNTNVNFYYSFFERPDWYNAYRPIFIEYLPLVRMLALAGWEPVPYARAGDERMLVERFGSGATLNLVAYNPLHDGGAVTFDLDVQLPALGWPNGTPPVVANLSDGSAVPTSRMDDGVRLRLTLPARRAAVLAFRPSRSQLAAFDLGEVVRYVGIASGRLKDKMEQKLPVDFEADPGGAGLPTGYSHYQEGNVAYSSDGTVCHSVPRATKVVLHGQARATESTTTPVQPGRRYRFSFWAKAEFPSPGSVHCYVRWLDKGGKAIGNMVSSGDLKQTSDWTQLVLDVTSPEKAERASFVLVGARKGEGDATVWFDDPAVVEIGADGTETRLLPLTPKALPASARSLAVELEQMSGRLQALLDSAEKGAEAGSLCGQALASATEVGGKADALRRESADYGNVAAALTVAADRLRRAGGILNGWQAQIAVPATIAQGEAPEVVAQVTAGSAPIENLDIRVTAPEGWQPVPVAPAKSLAPEQTATTTIRLEQKGAEAQGGSVAVSISAQLAGGHVMTLQRSASFAVVPPCESSLAEQCQEEGGQAQRLLLKIKNMRREKPLKAAIAVTPARGFTVLFAGEANAPIASSIELSAGQEVGIPLLLKAGENEHAGWRQTTVKVAWEGGERIHEQPLLYAPPTANLLTNSSFEDGEKEATGWGRYGDGGYSLDTEVKHSGARSIRAVANAAVKAAGAVRALTLNQKVARPLVLRGWSLYQKPGGEAEEIKTIGMTEHAGLLGGERSPDYSLYVDLHYVGGGALYGQAAPFDKTLKGWQFSQKTISVAKPVQDVTVYLLFRGQDDTAWFDDVFLAEAEPNLAQTPGAKVTTDGSFSGYTAEPLTDGVTDTRSVDWAKAAWASAEEKGEHWAQIALPQPVDVKTVLIYWATEGGTIWTSRNYSVQAFVNGAWLDLVKVTGATPRDFSVHNFAPVKTDRVRIHQPEGGGHANRPMIMWLREIEVY